MATADEAPPRSPPSDRTHQRRRRNSLIVTFVIHAIVTHVVDPRHTPRAMATTTTYPHAHATFECESIDERPSRPNRPTTTPFFTNVRNGICARWARASFLLFLFSSCCFFLASISSFERLWLAVDVRLAVGAGGSTGDDGGVDSMGGKLLGIQTTTKRRDRDETLRRRKWGGSDKNAMTTEQLSCPQRLRLRRSYYWLARTRSKLERAWRRQTCNDSRRFYAIIHVCTLAVIRNSVVIAISLVCRNEMIILRTIIFYPSWL